jgi:hypothetical protein
LQADLAFVVAIEFLRHNVSRHWLVTNRSDHDELGVVIRQNTPFHAQIMGEVELYAAYRDASPPPLIKGNELSI